MSLIDLFPPQWQMRCVELTEAEQTLKDNLQGMQRIVDKITPLVDADRQRYDLLESSAQRWLPQYEGRFKNHFSAQLTSVQKQYKWAEGYHAHAE